MKNETLQAVQIQAPNYPCRLGVSRSTKGELLTIQEALQIKAAEYWLKLGQADQALKELESLPSRIWIHRWALETRIAALGVLSRAGEMMVQS